MLTAVSTEAAEGVHVASLGKATDARPAAANPRPRCDQGILCTHNRLLADII